MLASDPRRPLFGIDVPADGPLPPTPAPGKPHNPHPDPHGDPGPDRSPPPAGDPNPESHQPPTGDPSPQPDGDPLPAPMGDPPPMPDSDPVSPPAGDPPVSPPNAMVEGDGMPWPAFYVPGVGWQDFNPAHTPMEYSRLILMGVDMLACVRH